MSTPIDLTALKNRQMAAWASGDYAVIDKDSGTVLGTDKTGGLIGHVGEGTASGKGAEGKLIIRNSSATDTVSMTRFARLRRVPKFQ